MGGQQALFYRKFMEACEAKEHGRDSKQRQQVGGPIMQAKVWMREFGRCNLWSTWALKSQSEDDHAGENRAWEEPEATQAGRPRPAGWAVRPPLFKHPPVLFFGTQATLPTICLCA
jgi:hypothetical protein